MIDKANMKTKLKLIIGFLILIFGIVSFSNDVNVKISSIEAITLSKIETFTFSSNGTIIKGKIFLPASYKTNKSLPAIYLIDFKEQHFKVATDEFEKVIDAVRQIQGFDAMVVTLEEHLDFDVQPDGFRKYYDIFKNLTYYVDGKYTNNTSRTFIGRGSEAGVVLITLFLENLEYNVFDNFIATDSPGSFNSAVIRRIEKSDFPNNKKSKKLHFSFSLSNDADQCTKLINMLDKTQYPWLQFKSNEYSNSNYENTYPVAFADGIKYIFSK